MTHAPVAASVRPCFAALIVAAVLAFLVAGPAEGAARASGVYLAPASACPGSSDPAASPAVQRRAIGCLVNWARRADGRSGLATSRSLQRAATLKGQKVAACGQLSHTPCGALVVAAVRASGYRYASFGENLMLGPWGEVSARDVVAAWLNSPTHRANVLRGIFRDFGAALVRDGDEAVWVATFASPL